MGGVMWITLHIRTKQQNRRFVQPVKCPVICNKAELKVMPQPDVRGGDGLQACGLC